MLKKISSAIKKVLATLLLGLRPLLGPATCRYPIGCTSYALQQLKTESLHRALWNITKRLIACNPFV